jgi:hypothetical protein
MMFPTCSPPAFTHRHSPTGFPRLDSALKIPRTGFSRAEFHSGDKFAVHRLDRSDSFAAIEPEPFLSLDWSVAACSLCRKLLAKNWFFAPDPVCHYFQDSIPHAVHILCSFCCSFSPGIRSLSDESNEFRHRGRLSGKRRKKWTPEYNRVSRPPIGQLVNSAALHFAAPQNEARRLADSFWHIF